MEDIKPNLQALLENVEIKAVASSQFTVETIDARLAVLDRGNVNHQEEIAYLYNLKRAKGW